jgi:hypothetical protein
MGRLGDGVSYSMNNLPDRDERFIRAWSYWYPALVIAMLPIACYVLPQKTYKMLETLAVDTAEPMGRLAGKVYCCIRDFGDFVHWMICGPRTS